MKTIQLENWPNTLINTSSKKIYKWKIGIWKKMLYIMSSEKCRLNQWDITTDLLEWPKSRILILPNASGVIGTLTHCWWEYKMIQLLWKTVRQFLTKLNILNIWSSNCAPWYLFKGVENLCLHKTLHTMWMAVLFIIVETWKQPRCSPVKWMNK